MKYLLLLGSLVYAGKFFHLMTEDKKSLIILSNDYDFKDITKFDMYSEVKEGSLTFKKHIKPIKNITNESHICKLEDLEKKADCKIENFKNIVGFQKKREFVVYVLRDIHILENGEFTLVGTKGEKEAKVTMKLEFEKINEGGRDISVVKPNDNKEHDFEIDYLKINVKSAISYEEISEKIKNLTDLAKKRKNKKTAKTAIGEKKSAEDNKTDKNDGDDTPWYKTKTFIALVIAGLIIIIGVSVFYFKD